MHQRYGATPQRVRKLLKSFTLKKIISTVLPKEEKFVHFSFNTIPERGGLKTS